MRMASVTLLALCLGLLAAAAYRSVRLAAADRFFFSASSESIRRATILEPRNASYHAGRAELLAGEGKDAASELLRAVASNPDEAELRIRLGLDAEQRGDLEEAEAELLTAALQSRKYAPRWTLTNYYFRRGDSEAFWHWAHEAFDASYAVRQPLFALCHRVSPSSEVVLERAIPERRAVRLDYASFLGGIGQWSLAGRLLEELARDATAAESPGLLSMTNHLLAARQFTSARGVWNALSRLGRLPYPPLQSAAAAVSLRNDDFRREILNAGFDWRMPGADGVYISQSGQQGLLITLSGDRRADAGILYQYFPVEPLQNYRIECFYRSSLAPGEEAGLEWQVQFPETDETGAGHRRSAESRR